MNGIRSGSAVALALGLLAGVSNANILAFSGDTTASTEGTGSNFAGTLDYSFNGGNSGTLVVSLTNTTPVSVGGYLTAFAFNVDSSDNSSTIALSNTTDADFLNAQSVNAMPFGHDFKGGAGLGGVFQGGGAPQPGIAIGVTETFTFNITAIDANALTEASFLEGPYAYDFVVRFRGLTNGGSDKVPTPTPGPVALAGIAGLMASRRRR